MIPFSDAAPLVSSTLINSQDATHRPVKIKYFVKISYAVCFVVVAWFKPHPSQFEIGKPAQVWCEQLLKVLDYIHFYQFINYVVVVYILP